MKSFHRRRYLAAAAVLGVAATSLAEDVVVKTEPAIIREGKGKPAPIVAQLRKGDMLKVLGHDGPWVKVSVNGKEGYVGENNLASATGGGGDFLGLGAKSANASGSNSASTGAAGKGGLPSEEWAKANGKNMAGLERMIALSNAFTEAEWKQFMQDGHVGSGRK
jgi:hypothetical protein